VTGRANPLTSTSSPSSDSGTHAAATGDASDREPSGQTPTSGVVRYGVPHELERRLQERLDALGLAPRAELLHVLRRP
jgi:hypothetical protein